MILTYQQPRKEPWRYELTKTYLFGASIGTFKYHLVGKP
jgi:hypothetical protein